MSDILGLLTVDLGLGKLRAVDGIGHTRQRPAIRMQFMGNRCGKGDMSRGCRVVDYPAMLEPGKHCLRFLIVWEERSAFTLTIVFATTTKCDRYKWHEKGEL
jgi:hypothetical protein